jgi:uncharacterized protein
MIDLKAEYLEMVKEILDRLLPKGFEAWAFGSRVTGTAKKFSDLDIAVIGPRRLTLLESANLREAFSESDLPIMVDVIDYFTTDPNFQKIIDTHREKLAP